MGVLESAEGPKFGGYVVASHRFDLYVFEDSAPHFADLGILLPLLKAGRQQGKLFGLLAQNAAEALLDPCLVPLLSSVVHLVDLLVRQAVLLHEPDEVEVILAQLPRL